MKIRSTLAVLGLFAALGSTGVMASNTQHLRDIKTSNSTGYNDKSIKVNGVNGYNGYTGVMDDLNGRSTGIASSRD